MNVGAIRIQITLGKLHFLREVLCRTRAVGRSRAVPPSHDRVVIVSARICHAMMRVIVRLKVRGMRVLTKGELQNRHARKSKSVPQTLDFWCNHAKVLSQNGQVTERRLHSVEQRCSRPLHPLSIDSCGLCSGNLVVRFESAEMIEPDHVEHLKCSPEAGDPPLKSGFGVYVP